MHLCEVSIEAMNQDTTYIELKKSGNKSISNFLLSKINSSNKKILNTKDSIGNLTFTDLKKIFMVNENDISDEKQSPILSF